MAKNERECSRVTRRDLLRGAGRLAGLGVIAGWLAHTAARQGEARAGVGLCGACPALGGCSLPPGVRAQQSLARGGRAVERAPAGADRLCGAPGGKAGSVSREG